MISKPALKKLTEHHGAPVILKLSGEGDLGIVSAHCQRALNAQDFLCLEGPGDGELAVFNLAAAEGQK